MRRVLGWAVVLALGLYAILVAAVYSQQSAMLYPGASNARVDPDAPPPWGEWRTFQTRDGARISAIYQPAEPGRPTVILFAGNGDDVRNYGFVADRFAAQGIGLLAPSYRGFPGSDGTPSEAALLADSLLVFDWLRTQTSEPIVLLGRSLGTGVAVNVAAERPSAKAFVLLSPYDSIASVAAAQFPFLPVRLLIKDPFRSDQRISRAHQPSLMFHGDVDQTIDLERGRTLFNLANDPKQFVVLAGVGHNDIWTNQVLTQIVEFIDKLD